MHRIGETAFYGSTPCCADSFISRGFSRLARLHIPLGIKSKGMNRIVIMCDNGRLEGFGMGCPETESAIFGMKVEIRIVDKIIILR